MKKRVILFVIFLSTVTIAFCQDVMTMKNGNEVKVKIIEILPTTVKYKKIDNLDGPSYTESKSNIFMIKYKNGSKDVFKEQSVENTVISPDEEKKSHAVEKLTGFFSGAFNFKNPILQFVSFKKTNGVMRNFNGQFIYEVEFELTIKFLRDGYKLGNGAEGYWTNFTVWPTEPVLNESQAFIYSSKFFPAGTVAVLDGVANMANSDNGYELKNYEIKKVGLSESKQNEAANQSNLSTTARNSQHEGIYNSFYPNGSYQLVNNTIYFKSNSALISSFSLNGFRDDSSPGDVRVNGNIILGTLINLNGFTRSGDRYSYVYSLSITLDDGTVFENQDNIQSYSLNDPCIFSFNYNTPSLKNGAAARDFYMNFVIKDNNSDAILHGYYKFKLIP